MSWIDAFLTAVRGAQASGIPLIQRPTINFTGAGVVAVDDPNTKVTTVTIAAAPAGTTVSAKAAATSDITLSGTQSIDGVSCGVDDVVLLAGQDSAPENGLWKVKNTTWERADISLVAGLTVFVQGGTQNKGATFALVQVSPPTFIRLAPQVDVKLFGAKGDGRLATVSMTSGSHTVSGITFEGADVGKLATVQGAGPGGSTLITTVASSTTLTAVASGTVSGAELCYATDDTAAIDNALASIAGSNSPTRAVYFPTGLYGCTGINIRNHLNMVGGSRALFGAGVAGSSHIRLMARPSFGATTTNATITAPVTTFTVTDASAFQPGQTIRIENPATGVADSVIVTVVGGDGHTLTVKARTPVSNNYASGALVYRDCAALGRADSWTINDIALDGGRICPALELAYPCRGASGSYVTAMGGRPQTLPFVGTVDGSSIVSIPGSLEIDNCSFDHWLVMQNPAIEGDGLESASYCVDNTNTNAFQSLTFTCCKFEQALDLFRFLEGSCPTVDCQGFFWARTCLRVETVCQPFVWRNFYTEQCNNPFFDQVHTADVAITGQLVFDNLQINASADINIRGMQTVIFRDSTTGGNLNYTPDATVGLYDPIIENFAFNTAGKGITGTAPKRVRRNGIVTFELASSGPSKPLETTYLPGVAGAQILSLDSNATIGIADDAATSQIGGDTFSGGSLTADRSWALANPSPGAIAGNKITVTLEGAAHAQKLTLTGLSTGSLVLANLAGYPRWVELEYDETGGGWFVAAKGSVDKAGDFGALNVKATDVYLSQTAPGKLHYPGGLYESTLYVGQIFTGAQTITTGTPLVVTCTVTGVLLSLAGFYEIDPPCPNNGAGAGVNPGAKIGFHSMRVSANDTVEFKIESLDLVSASLAATTWNVWAKLRGIG